MLLISFFVVIVIVVHFSLLQLKDMDKKDKLNIVTNKVATGINELISLQIIYKKKLQIIYKKSLISIFTSPFSYFLFVICL